MRRIITGLLAMLTALTLGVTVGAAPAQAVYAGTCATNAICFYPWINFGGQASGDRWQSSFNNIVNYNGGCVNLYGATWDNGQPVNNNSGSLMYVSSSGYDDYVIRLYDWENCNGSGPNLLMAYAGTAETHKFADLRNLDFSGTISPLYHRVTSIKIYRLF